MTVINLEFMTVIYLEVLVIYLLVIYLGATLISLDTDRLEDPLDVRSRRRGIATKAEKKISCKIFHFIGCVRRTLQL